MANSYVEYTGDNSTLLWSVTFPFRNREDVDVIDKADGSAITFTWISDAQISISPAVASSVSFRIRRQTKIDARVVDYQNATNLNELDLDLDSNQLFYLVQEAKEGTAEALALDAGFTFWDALSKQIKNVTDPTDAQDAATKNYVDAAVLGTLTGPAVIGTITIDSGSITDSSGTIDFGDENLTTTGTIDGRDVSADGSKLDGIESGATADQTAGEIEAIVNHDNLLGFNADEHTKNNLTATIAPTATDDASSGYSATSIWVDTVADVAYICVDPTATAAIWQEVGAGGGGGNALQSIAFSRSIR